MSAFWVEFKMMNSGQRTQDPELLGESKVWGQEWKGRLQRNLKGPVRDSCMKRVLIFYGEGGLINMSKAAERSGKRRPPVYLCRNLCPNPSPFFSFLVGLFLLLLNCSFYIMDINPLLDACFANIFSPSVSHHFTLLIESFDITLDWKKLISPLWSPGPGVLLFQPLQCSKTGLNLWGSQQSSRENAWFGIWTPGVRSPIFYHLISVVTSQHSSSLTLRSWLFLFYKASDRFKWRISIILSH